MDWGAIATVATACGTTLIAAGMLRERLGNLVSGQAKLQCSIDELKTSGVRTETSLQEFHNLENERHERQDVVNDDLLGEIRRHGREINELKEFRARASERMGMNGPGEAHA